MRTIQWFKASLEKLSDSSMLLPLFLLLTKSVISEKGVMTDYCEKDIFRAACSSGEVVFMQEARYGRMELGTCLQIDIGFMGCFRDLLPVMDGLCSGRRSCEIEIRDLMTLTNPCPDEVRSYLQAKYTCLPVADYGDQCCQFPSNRVLVTAGSGYLASIETLSTGCGNRDCPLRLEALPGQRINISVYDFGSHNEPSEALNDNSPSGGPCTAYANLKEKAVGVTMTICGGEERKRHLYTSVTNSVEIHIDIQKVGKLDVPYFIVEYEAFGCADPIQPGHGYLQREGDHATFSCLDSPSVIWEVTCHDGQWLGVHDNCSSVIPPPTIDGEDDDTSNDTGNKKHLEFNMAVILVIGVAVVVAIAILSIGVLCLLWVMKKPKQRNSNDNERRIQEDHAKVCRSIEQVGKTQLKEFIKQVRFQDPVYSINDHNQETIPELKRLHSCTDNAAYNPDCCQKPLYQDTSIDVGTLDSLCYLPDPEPVPCSTKKY